jgi:mannose-6-phosphate isomerase-like protein (cupin superfamily)
MQFVRPVDWDLAQVRLPGGYRGQYLYSGESCFIIATKVPPGSAGPPRHVHPVDQTYYVVEGRIDLALGTDEVSVESGSAVFIPAGLPHQNWNRGPVDEIHVEVIAPGILPLEPVATASDQIDAPGLAGFVASGDPGKFGGDEFVQDWLVDRSRGATHAGVYLAEVPPHKSGPPLHVHDFDQFYFVLSGQMSVEIGLSRFTVDPGNLVILPAQVPHRQWNDLDVPEQHLAILCPEPTAAHTPEHPWDTAVQLTETGEIIE